MKLLIEEDMNFGLMLGSGIVAVPLSVMHSLYGICKPKNQ
jgi:hypothetical protein